MLAYKLTTSYMQSWAGYYGLDIIQYKLNEWVKPNKNCGPIAVFESAKHIHEFLPYYKHGSSRSSRIFLCEIKPSKKRTLWICGTSTHNKIVSRKDFFPKGTILADAVKLIKEIQI